MSFIFNVIVTVIIISVYDILKEKYPDQPLYKFLIDKVTTLFKK